MSKWISMKDGSPEDGQHCLFWVPRRGDDFHFSGYIDDDGHMVDCDGDDIGYTEESVSHWMPLPEPPEKDNGQ